MAMMEEDTARYVSSGARTFVSFLIGAAAGAVTALLLAPYTGQESREKIKDAARSARERVGKIPSAMREAGTAAKDAFGESTYEGTHS
jgi:gas vesicle protein